jgi:hypothetical protein
MSQSARARRGRTRAAWLEALPYIREFHAAPW